MYELTRSITSSLAILHPKAFLAIPENGCNELVAPDKQKSKAQSDCSTIPAQKLMYHDAKCKQFK